MTQARKSEVDIGWSVCDEATRSAMIRAVDRLEAAMPPGMTFEQYYQEHRRLMARGRWVAAWKLWGSCNHKERNAASLELCRLIQKFRWYIDDVPVPEEVERELLKAPARHRKTMMQGVAAAFRGLTKAHPRLDRILETAAARREEGQVFAEASRERRDELYRERVAWIAEKYQEIRGKYAPGVDGDKAARLEVAYAYAKVTGKKPMHDRSVRNILDAAAEIAARDHAETPG